MPDITNTLAYQIEQLWLNASEQESWQFAIRLAEELKVSPHHLYGTLTNLCIVINPLDEK